MRINAFIYLFTLVFFELTLLGCAIDSSISGTILDTSSVSSMSTLPEYSKTQISLLIEWETNSSIISLQYSTNDIDWIDIISLEGKSKSFQFIASDYGLEEGVYWLRLKAGSNTSKIGTVVLDDTPPNTPADESTVECTEGGSFNFNLSSVTDNISDVTYELVEAPIYGTVSNCLDGTDSTSCTFTWDGGLPMDPDDTVKYRAVDKAGNKSPIATFSIDAACAS